MSSSLSSSSSCSLSSSASFESSSSSTTNTDSLPSNSSGLRVVTRLHLGPLTPSMRKGDTWPQERLTRYVTNIPTGPNFILTAPIGYSERLFRSAIDDNLRRKYNETHPNQTVRTYEELQSDNKSLESSNYRLKNFLLIMVGITIMLIATVIVLRCCLKI